MRSKPEPSGAIKIGSQRDILKKQTTAEGEAKTRCMLLANELRIEKGRGLTGWLVGNTAQLELHGLNAGQSKRSATPRVSLRFERRSEWNSEYWLCTVPDEQTGGALLRYDPQLRGARKDKGYSACWLCHVHYFHLSYIVVLIFKNSWLIPEKKSMYIFVMEVVGGPQA